jgi:hypothetical protein
VSGLGDTWELVGEGVAAVARFGHAPRVLPPGVTELPGPGLVTALRYTDSTVGPFLELALAVPARAGSHMGWCRVLVVVDRPEVRTAMRAHWGLPCTVGTLRWLARDQTRELVWEERDLVVRGRGRGPVLPWLTPQPLILERHGAPVIAPGRARGTLKLSRVTVQTYPGDELAPVAGGHPGVVLRGLHHNRGPARALRGPGLLPARSANTPEPALCEPVLCERVP